MDLPPWRERTEDIPLLIDYFVEKLTHGSDERSIGLQITLEMLKRYDWPDNVRELRALLKEVTLKNLMYVKSACHCVLSVPITVRDSGARYPAGKRGGSDYCGRCRSLDRPAPTAQYENAKTDHFVLLTEQQW